MSRVKYNPFRPFQPVGLDQFFDEVAGRSLSEFLGSDFVSASPSVNITEDDGGYMIAVAAPGLQKSDFTIELDNDKLVISAKKESEATDTDSGKYSRKEFNYSTFSRSFHLNDDISKEDIDATYVDGILTISLRKVAPEPEIKRTIEIG